MVKKATYTAVGMLCLLLCANGFGQSINASVGGTVSDSSKALIPGVTVTATNAGTGIVNTTVTNESGAYSFPALQPGSELGWGGLAGPQAVGEAVEFFQYVVYNDPN